MKKQAYIYTLLLLFICCVSCNRQHKKDLPKDSTNAKSKDMVATYGPSSITRTIKQDRTGNIWFASWEGIIQYDGSSFTNITKGVSLSRFFSVLEDRKGNFWFASIGSGVYYYDGNTFQNFTTNEGLINDRVTNIYEDKKGNIWFGTEGGASCYNGKSFQNFTKNEGLPHNEVNSIIEDKSGKFWFGTREGTCIYDGTKITNFINKDNKSFKNVRAIIEDKKGNIWLGGDNGLWQYDGSIFTQFTEKFVGYIYEDKKGNIWTSSVSDNGKGWSISRYDEESLSNAKSTVTEVIAQQGMLFGILEDSEGGIWFGTLNGAYRYDGNTFNDFKDPKLKVGN